MKRECRRRLTASRRASRRATRKGRCYGCSIPAPAARRAAVLALGLVGTMKANKTVAGMLRDDDRITRQLASDALWSLWFRADSDANSRELRRLIQVSDPKKAVAGLDALINKAPHFAEAYNQRATLHYRLGDFTRSIADCDRASS